MLGTETSSAGTGWAFTHDESCWVPQSHIDSGQQKMPFHGKQAEKLLGISFPFTSTLLFKNPPISRRTQSTSNARKLVAFTSLKFLQATSPQKEGVASSQRQGNHPESPAVEVNFTLKHQQPLTHITGVQQELLNQPAGIRDILEKLPSPLPWELELRKFSFRRTEDTDLLLPQHCWSHWLYFLIFFFQIFCFPENNQIITFNIFLLPG